MASEPREPPAPRGKSLDAHGLILQPTSTLQVPLIYKRYRYNNTILYIDIIIILLQEKQKKKQKNEEN